MSYSVHMKQTLTTKSLDAMKPATVKRYEVRDAKVNGLHVRVSTTGARMFYTMSRANGKRRRIKIGSYPVISLADARRRATEIARSIELGEFDVTPGIPEETVPTLGEVIPKFIEIHAKPNTKDWKRTQSVLRKFDGLNDRPLDQIKRQDVTKVLDGIIANGTPTRANRALSAIKKLMNWCAMRGTIETSPVAPLRPPTREVQRDRVLTDDEIRAIWRHSETEGYPFGPFLKLLKFTGQRRSEVSGMRWSELNLDEGIWELPASRVKNARLHIVPLPPQAVDILRSLHRFLNSDFVFTTTGRSSISGFGRLKARIEATLPENTQDWRFHDFRRTASTGMAKIGVMPHVIDAVTNHKSGVVSGVGATYNRYTYLNEKREALEQWADHVEESTRPCTIPSAVQ
ncbi:Prophage integrase IntS [Roseobacter fucihabitans]|uniref:Prophage integrase IntS n=2 Tax=Roseobacter fucihabitans TaxID=1537242 RepID=A0ABZ2BXN9_9RHOB|nr:putative prophage CPS-53 integrase [Roseobacter litoralis]MBC6968073.1 putative prophage CPS-53 integrase [Roseobacter litoralis]